jgi:hypothetical protein
MKVAEERPPYVTFEVRAVEDRNASIEAGHYVATDVDYAFITPIGSKDRVERVVSEWFAKLEEDTRNQRFDPAWLRAYKEAYAAWKEGREMPVEGTAILTWPVLSPSQVKGLLDCQIRTVEDLAAANEETIARIGMGGRNLKQKALDWLSSAKTVGVKSEELTAVKQQNEDLKAKNEALAKQVADLAAKVKALESAKK